jgi:hypothetical protein
MIEKLKDVFFRVLTGMSIEKAHFEDKSVENLRQMYPLRNYLRDIKLNTYE